MFQRLQRPFYVLEALLVPEAFWLQDALFGCQRLGWTFWEITVTPKKGKFQEAGTIIQWSYTRPLISINHPGGPLEDLWKLVLDLAL